MTGSRSSVLLIDAHEDVREGLQMILESEGLTVETATDPRRALNRMIGGLRPCIILLDLMSPVMNGLEFRRELMDHPLLRSIPLLAYAGLKGVRAKAREIAVDASSHVPAEIDRLISAVRQHCAA